MTPLRRHVLRGSRERGSMSLLATGVMATLMVLSLASADLARVLSTASRAQTAADAAALAAAQEQVLPTMGSPQTAAADYASRNGATLVSCNCPSDGEEAVVEVRADVGHLMLFGDGRTVTARATAEVELPEPPDG